MVEVAARQRTLAERYVNEVLLVRAGARADPATRRALLAQSADALLDGGDGARRSTATTTRPTLPAADRRRPSAPQLEQERRLVADLTATGSALLAAPPGRPRVPLTAHERIDVTDPVERLRVLAALTSNVVAERRPHDRHDADHNISRPDHAPRSRSASPGC